MSGVDIFFTINVPLCVGFLVRNIALN